MNPVNTSMRRRRRAVLVASDEHGAKLKAIGFKPGSAPSRQEWKSTWQ
jgi:hypothetical protein